MAIGDCLLDGAIGFRGVYAIIKTALPEPGFELDKARCEFMVLQFPDSVFPDTGRIDQVSATGKLIQNGRGRSVCTLAGAGGQGAGLYIQVGQ